VQVTLTIFGGMPSGPGAFLLLILAASRFISSGVISRASWYGYKSPQTSLSTSSQISTSLSWHARWASLVFFSRSWTLRAAFQEFTEIFPNVVLYEHFSEVLA
jgi:hypothetical protein